MEPTVGQTELCARYRCDPRTLRKHARGAGVFGRKSGRERVYPLSEVRRLDEYLAQRAGAPPAGSPAARRPHGLDMRRLRARRTRQAAKHALDQRRLTPRRDDQTVVSLDLERQR
jgi:hypothetical protein